MLHPLVTLWHLVFRLFSPVAHSEQGHESEDAQ